MKVALPIIQIIISALLMIFVLLQAKGAGLGTAWGGGGEFYRSRRGVEKVLFFATITLATLFLISSLLGIILYS